MRSISSLLILLVTSLVFSACGTQHSPGGENELLVAQEEAPTVDDQVNEESVNQPAQPAPVPARVDDEGSLSSGQSPVCEAIESSVGACHGYGYECAEHPDSQSACLLEVFGLMDQPCGLFNTMAPRCAGSLVSEVGIGSCFVQECLGLTTADLCFESLRAECAAGVTY